MNKLTEQTKKVEKELLSCSRSSIDSIPALKAKIQAIKKGAKIKVIGSLTNKNKHIVKKWLKLGIEYRVYNEKKFGTHGIRFGIFDSRACRLTIGKPEVATATDYITLWSESPSMINMFRRQFYNMWEQCQPAEKMLKNL